MTRADMADYFVRLRAAPALPPPPPAEPNEQRPIILSTAPRPPAPVAQPVGKKGKRRKVQMTLV